MSDFDLVTIKVDDLMRKVGVLYVGQYGTSGYAIAAKGYICDFVMKGIPVQWVPLKFDNSEMSDENYYNIIAKSTINKPLEKVGTVILHCTADLWPKYKEENKETFSNRNVIGYTVWETSALPTSWPAFINQSVSEVWVPSHYNREVFVSSGVVIPVRVVPHIWLKNELPTKESVSLFSQDGLTINSDANVFTFYNISEFTERKNIIGLVRAFCKAFKRTDCVRLILKLHYQTYSDEDVNYCVKKIHDIMDDFPDHARILALTNNLSETELLGLHAIGDCYVSLTRSEAFGLTIFDAYNYGKNVIATGYGGHVDFLGKNHPGLVDYVIEDVKNMETFTHGYYNQGKQQWASPDTNHAAALMRRCYEKS